MKNKSFTGQTAVTVKGVSKFYKLYASPQDRLKEALNFTGKKYHKEFYATKNLNLEIKKGEILGIVGKNGSGKSTLLKLISGVLSPDEGQIKIKGKISALLELGSGFNPEFTGIQNIFFYGTILGLSKKEMDEKLDDIIEFADIGEFIDQPLKTYSSGMKSRLGFAVAVHIDPEILILDEVLSVGDILFQRKCYAKMEEFFNGGKTIIYVSHNLNSVNELCTRAIFLDAGKILLDADAKTVTSHYQKYLFASKSEKEILKKDMLNTLVNHKDTPAVKEEKKPKIPAVIDAFLAKDLQSKTKVNLGNIDVNIYDFTIETLEGRKVNILPFDQTFIFSYKVRFNDTADSLEGVNFGFQIKNVKGINISGTNTKRLEQQFPTVQTMQAYKISWHFKTNLLPAEYFMNATIFLKKDDEILYSKVLDAHVFKVISDNEVPFAGYTYLSQSFSIKKTSSA